MVDQKEDKQCWNIISLFDFWQKMWLSKSVIVLMTRTIIQYWLMILPLNVLKDLINFEFILFYTLSAIFFIYTKN